MSDPSPADAPNHAHVLVHPVVPDAMTGPYRRVDVLGESVGKAFKQAAADDVADIKRRTDEASEAGWSRPGRP